MSVHLCISWYHGHGDLAESAESIELAETGLNLAETGFKNYVKLVWIFPKPYMVLKCTQSSTVCLIFYKFSDAIRNSPRSIFFLFFLWRIPYQPRSPSLYVVPAMHDQLINCHSDCSLALSSLIFLVIISTNMCIDSLFRPTQQGSSATCSRYITLWFSSNRQFKDGASIAEEFS